MPIQILAFDGDDTLWHNESHFHLTQQALRDLLLKHAPDADVDRHLFDTEMANLRIYGYGIKSFMLSMLETAISVTEGRIPASDLEVILGWGKQMLQEPTKLLDGVAETLRILSPRYSLLLITKGDLFDQESKLARSGLGELFQGVEIVSDKTVATYRSVLARRRIEPRDLLMVGNSLRSDILPVVELGGLAVHIPYHLTWRHEHVADELLPADGWYRVRDIRELDELLASIGSKPGSANRHEIQSRPDRSRKRDSGPLSTG